MSEASERPSYLITGATGFIGRHLCRSLARRRMFGETLDVSCLVRPSSDTRELRELGLRCVEGDLGDQDSLRQAIAGHSHVIHLAALLRTPWRPSFAETNAAGCGRLAAACAAQSRPPALVLVSSMAAAGASRTRHPLTEDQPERPVSRYGRAKLLGERAARRYASALPLTILRPPMVFGEGDQAALPLFRLAERGVFPLPSWRERRLSLVHAEDLAELLMLAAERGRRVRDLWSSEGVYFAAAEDRPTWAELGQAIAHVLGRRAPWGIPIPTALTRIVGAVGELIGRIRDKPTILNLDKAREAAAGAWICSTEKIKSELGFRSSVGLLDRLDQTVRGYRESGWLRRAGRD